MTPGLLAEISRRWSPYSYCYNDPVRFTDPDGMIPDFMPGDPGDKKKKRDSFDDFGSSKDSPFERNNGETRNQLGNHIPDAEPSLFDEGKATKISEKDGDKKDNKEKKDKKDNGTSSKEQKKTDQSKDFVAMGFGMEFSALLYSMNIGFFSGYGTGLGSGGIVITFTSGVSNNLSATGYVSVVNEADKNTFKVTDLAGTGYEWSAGWKILSVTRATPTQTLVPYKITQISFGKGKFNPSGSGVQSKTIVIPMFNFIFGSPFK